MSKQKVFIFETNGLRFPIKGTGVIDVFQKVIDFNKGDQSWKCNGTKDGVFTAEREQRVGLDHPLSIKVYPYKPNS